MDEERRGRREKRKSDLLKVPGGLTLPRGRPGERAVVVVAACFPAFLFRNVAVDAWFKRDLRD